MGVLRGLTLLLIAQALGEATVRLARLPLPGPVMGLLLMWAALQWAPLREQVRPAAEGLLAHLSLLFVPVGVGVMTHLNLLGSYGLRLLIVLLLSTGLGLAVTAWLLRALLAREGQG